MAQPIKYIPVAETKESARHQLDELLQVMADSGTLRVAKDLLASMGPVADIISSRLETPEGRNALGNLTVLGTALTQLPPDELQRVVGAAVRGFGTATRLARRKPPGLVQMLLVLRSQNVRRTLVALLAFLYTVGELLRPENESETAMIKG